MKTILLPMLGYTIVPQNGISFSFPNSWHCYTDTVTNLNIYPYTPIVPVNTGGSGGVK